jgi:RHS repeat-associated protein
MANQWVRPLGLRRIGVCLVFLAGLGLIVPVTAPWSNPNPSDHDAFLVSVAFAETPTPASQGHGPAEPPGQEESKPAGPQDTPAATRARTEADPPTTTFTVDAFQADLFTGAAAAEVSIVVPPGAAGTAPRIVVRYNSSTVDELGPRDQGQGAGLGWTLDIGGFVLRDTKLTTSPGDDTFKLVFGGVSYDLVLVDGPQNIYHTKDETFLKLQYNAQGDYWTLWTKDGTRHRLGFNPDSKAIALGQDLVTPVTYKYLLDEATTTSGVSVRYAFTKQTATVASTGRSYDQAVYPDVITWSYQSGAMIGLAREVRFLRAPRSDWTDTSATTNVSFFERERLDSIEVRVGASLVRKYLLAFDYSIDRDPAFTWGGGATGDLALKSVTVYGADGISALPSLTFAYTNARLSSASNGIGGTVSYSFERVTTSAAIYRPQDFKNDETGGRCFESQFLSNTPTFNPLDCSAGTFLGYLVGSAVSGTSAAIYRPQVFKNDETGGHCFESQFLSNTPTFNPLDCSAGTFLGHLVGSAVSGTSAAIYRPQDFKNDETGGHCFESQFLSNTPTFNPLDCSAGTFLGHLYVASFDRHRVVARTVSDGRGGSTTMTFSYTGLGLSSDGKEFRGHAAVRAVDAAGAYTDTWFNQGDALKGRAYQSETRSSSNALYTRTVNTWSATNPYPGVTFVALTRSDVSTCDGGASCRQTAQSLEYDAFGNLSRIYYWGDIAVSGDERDERMDWLVDAANWIHRPNRTALHDAALAVVRERWLSYDGLAWGALGGRGLLTREESRLAGPLGTVGNPVATHTYDANGNPTGNTDTRGCATSITYESDQTYPASVTSCLGHTTSFAYDVRWGVKVSQTDPNGQATTYAYDTFGRPTKVVGPLDTASLYGSVSHFYLDFGSPSLQRVLTYRTEQHGTANVRWSEEYFDGLGRVYLSRAEGPGGQIIQSETTFDARGLGAARSAPHFSTEAAVSTQFTYDALARQTQVRHPDGTTATTAYAPGLVTLTDERGNVTRKFSDAYGRLTRVEEVNGTETYATTYAYDATGALVRVTNHLGHVTTMTYDSLGRKVALQDPNMGSWSYSYDLTGNMVSQTDAKNQTLTFTYDLQGRILTKRYPSGAQVQWAYDEPAVLYSKGRLTTMTDPETVTSFSYDPLGRVTQTSRLLDGTTYTMAQTYDALGRVTSRTFPDGETVTYTFNEAGWLSSMPNYVTSITYNARGQRTQVQYANGTTSTWTYHAQNFRVTNHSTSGPGAVGLQNLSYTHDPVGNITQITDPLYTGSRTFTYDALNRLTSASGPFGPNLTAVTQSYRYNAIGNLLEKAGVLYSYTDPLHPAAVTDRSDGKSYSYDANGNMVTGAGRAMTWDVDNRLATVTTQGGNSATFAYDYTGQRVRKTTSTGVTRYPFANYEIGADGVAIKRLGFAAKKSTGQVLFYHNDHLGGVNVITDAVGTRVQLIEYDPWGAVSREEGTVEPTVRFTGQRLDPETGLMYYVGRYYDPTLGRFISADPFVPRPSNPQALNRYSYVLNDPVNATDPSGYFFKFFKKAFRFHVKLHKAHIDFQRKEVAPVVAPIVVGVVVGSAAAGLCAPAGPVVAGICGGVVGGAAAAAVSTAFNGGDLGRNVAIGAALGGIGGALGAVVGPVASQALGPVGGAVATGVVVGGAVGAIGAAITGGDIGQAVLLGAVTSGVLSGALAYANTLSAGYEQPATGDASRFSPEARALMASAEGDTMFEANVPEGQAARAAHAVGVDEAQGGWTIVRRTLFAIARNLAGGPGRYYGAIALGTVGYVSGSLLGGPPLGLYTGAVGAYVGGEVGGLFDPTYAGKLNYGEPDMTRYPPP